MRALSILMYECITGTSLCIAKIDIIGCLIIYNISEISPIYPCSTIEMDR